MQRLSFAILPGFKVQNCRNPTLFLQSDTVGIHFLIIHAPPPKALEYIKVPCSIALMLQLCKDSIVFNFEMHGCFWQMSVGVDILRVDKYTLGLLFKSAEKVQILNVLEA